MFVLHGRVLLDLRFLLFWKHAHLSRFVACLLSPSLLWIVSPPAASTYEPALSHNMNYWEEGPPLHLACCVPVYLQHLWKQRPLVNIVNIYSIRLASCGAPDRARTWNRCLHSIRPGIAGYTRNIDICIYIYILTRALLSMPLLCCLGQRLLLVQTTHFFASAHFCIFCCFAKPG